MQSNVTGRLEPYPDVVQPPSYAEACESNREDTPKYFFIHNSWSNKLLDVEENDKRPGTHLIIYRKKDPPSANQLWYFDENGYIRSKLNDFCIDTSESDIIYTYARLRPPDESSKYQKWQYDKESETIRRADDPEKVLDVKWGWRINCSKVIQYKYHGRQNQRFELHYI